MARWLVTQGDRQFSAQDLNELKRLAAEGRLGPGDMVQPPGASDWLYATELPELKGLFPGKGGRREDDDDDVPPRRGLPQGPVIAILVLLVLLSGYGMYYYAVRVPNGDALTFDLGLTELQVTADPAQLRAQPAADAAVITTLPKDSRIQLQAKRGDFYHVAGEGGSPEGWVSIQEVIAGYQFKDARTREDYDPIFNPDHYVSVQNSNWMAELETPPAPGQRPPPPSEFRTTVFQFMLKNRSKFEMTDIVLLATIKDEGDRPLERREIEIEGSIPPFASVGIGTLAPPEDAAEGTEGRVMTEALYSELTKDDPDLQMRWTFGVEVPIAARLLDQASGDIEANIDLLELRAVPRKIE